MIYHLLENFYLKFDIFWSNWQLNSKKKGFRSHLLKLLNRIFSFVFLLFLSCLWIIITSWRNLRILPFFQYKIFFFNENSFSFRTSEFYHDDFLLFFPFFQRKKTSKFFFQLFFEMLENFFFSCFLGERWSKDCLLMIFFCKKKKI